MKLMLEVRMVEIYVIKKRVRVDGHIYLEG